MAALYPSDQKWGTDNNVTVTLRGGQATRHDVAAALPLESRKRTLKTAGTQKKILFDHMPIEAPRWALLQRLTKPDLISTSGNLNGNAQLPGKNKAAAHLAGRSPRLSVSN